MNATDNHNPILGFTIAATACAVVLILLANCAGKHASYPTPEPLARPTADDYDKACYANPAFCSPAYRPVKQERNCSDRLPINVNLKP